MNNSTAKQRSEGIIKSMSKLETLHWDMEDPFLFCAHHKDVYPAGNEQQGIDLETSDRPLGSNFELKDGYRMYHGEIVPGFPAHPHKGFETVTVTRVGLVDHFDSVGAYGRYGEGDVQWLTTGKGCQHSEMFPLVNETVPNPLEIFQIWLNLPKHSKLSPPAYNMFWKEDIPVIKKQTKDEKGNICTAKLELIAGSFDGKQALDPNPNSWAADKKNHVGIYWIELEPGAEIAFPGVSETLNRNLYFYSSKKAEIQIGEEKIQGKHRIKLDGNKDIKIKNVTQEIAHMMLLEGEPINEPVVQYGPFVMTSKKEVLEAINEYQRTQFGGWPFGETSDPVNERDSGRFANYGDGRIEKKGKQ